LIIVDAKSVARALVRIFWRHSYIPTILLTDLGSVFISKMFHELTALIEIKLQHASVKHAHTLGDIERSHSALKKVLKIYENPAQTNWYKYVDFAVFVHNTSFHTSIGCTLHMVRREFKGDGYGAWTKLKLHFKSSERILSLMTKLTGIKLKTAESVQNYAVRAEDIWNALDEARKPVDEIAETLC
jgi:hypothetical protein